MKLSEYLKKVYGDMECFTKSPEQDYISKPFPEYDLDDDLGAVGPNKLDRPYDVFLTMVRTAHV